jgi:hypothetical protein
MNRKKNRWTAKTPLAAAKPPPVYLNPDGDGITLAVSAR